jgi:DNA-binding MarR family transcriptional regulator
MPMATTSSLDVANRLRPALMRLARSLRREADELGITGGQAALLGMISVQPELSVRELAVHEGMSAPVLTRYLDRLESRGLLRRRPDPLDGRRVQLSLTRRGDRVLQSVRSRRTAWLAARLEGLSAAELEAIEAAIDPLLRLLEDGA